MFVCKSLYPDDLVSVGEAVLLQVFCQVEERVSLQIVAVAEEDEKALLLDVQTHTNTHQDGFLTS